MESFGGRSRYPLPLKNCGVNCSSLGVDAMRKQSRSLLLLSVLAGVLLGGACAGVNAAQQPKTTRWSDPATWPNHKVPVAGALVDIPSGKSVLLDVSPPPLNGVTIHGKLSFSDKSDLELTTEWVMLHG
ncbi:MAG TPA: G8 domain-containing protein, partial [Steroidobacteraceae bacterium]|nr:G8 domain-containing protein [Steroidobacteraceae bacterium]